MMKYVDASENSPSIAPKNKKPTVAAWPNKQRETVTPNSTKETNKRGSDRNNKHCAYAYWYNIHPLNKNQMQICRKQRCRSSQRNSDKHYHQRSPRQIFVRDLASNWRNIRRKQILPLLPRHEAPDRDPREPGPTQPPAGLPGAQPRPRGRMQTRRSATGSRSASSTVSDLLSTTASRAATGRISAR